MSHLTPVTIHGYSKRGLDVRVDVDTEGDPEDFTVVGFRVADVINRTDLTPTAGGSGVTVDFTLTAEEMDIVPGWYQYECFAVVADEPRTIAFGQFQIGSEPTAEEESS